MDLLIAVIIDWIIGDPYWFPHPVIYIGKLIKCLENNVRKKVIEPKKMKVAGLGIVLIVVAVSFIIPFVVLQLVKPYNVLYHIVNILFLWTVIAARCLHNEGIKVYEELKDRNIKEARIKLSYIVGRETKDLSEDEIIRADVETIAENASDGIVAPLLFAAIGGAPLAMAYKAINTMDSMLGYKNEKYIDIGFFPAKIDDIFNYIPARITGVLMSLSSPIVKGNVIESLKIMIRDRKNHKSPNCAYPEAACAGAIGIQLGGENTYFGEKVWKPTIGDKKRELEFEDIKRSIVLMYSSEVLFMVCYSVIYLIL